MTIVFYQLHSCLHNSIENIYTLFNKNGLQMAELTMLKASHYFKSFKKMLYTNLFDGHHFKTDDYIILNFLHHINYIKIGTLVY